MATPNRDHPPGTWRPDIDGLRAFAVLAVVLHHYFPSAVRGGFIGVDVFFVISGFLIGGILLDAFAENRFNLLDFYARRARRILPSLLLVLGACLFFGYFALLPEDYANLGKHTAGGAGFISNLLLYGEAGYFDNASETKPLLHLWSLGIEEQFYLVFPLFLYVISWGLWAKQRRVFLGIMLAALLSFGWNLGIYRTDAAFNFYMPMTRFWELLAGVLLALWQRRSGPFATAPATSTEKPRRWGGKQHWVAGIGLFLLFISLKAQERGFPGVQALVPVLGTVMLIAAGMKSDRPTLFNRWLAWRPLVWVGLISYPLYLWHWPLLVFPRIILGEMPTSLLRLLLFALAVILAALTYRLVERPLRFGKVPGVKAIGLSTALVLLGLTGLVIHLQKSKYETNQLRLLNRSHTQTSDETCRRRYADMYNSLEAISEFADASAKFRPYCRYYDAQGARTIVVWGDSHALAAFEAIASYNASRKINTWLVGRSSFRNIPAKALPRVIDRIAQSIQQSPDVHSIFLILRAGKMDPRRMQHVHQPIISRMNQLGKQIYVLADNPELSFDPRILDQEQPLRTTLHAFQGTSAFPRLYKIDAIGKQKDYLSALNHLHEATIIHSMDAFCPTDKCLLFDEEGGSLYRDENHLSRYSGGRFLVRKVLKPYLDKVANEVTSEHTLTAR